MRSARERVLAYTRVHGRVGLGTVSCIVGSQEAARVLLDELVAEGLLRQNPKAGGFILAPREEQEGLG